MRYINVYRCICPCLYYNISYLGHYRKVLERPFVPIKLQCHIKALSFNHGKRIFGIFRSLFLDRSVQVGLIDFRNRSLFGDGSPIYTAAQERKNVLAIASRRESMIATASIVNLTVTLARISTSPAIILVMLSICSLPPIPKMFFRHFLSWTRFSGMIHMSSFMHGIP